MSTCSRASRELVGRRNRPAQASHRSRCSHSEREAVRLLAAQGLEAEKAEQVLAHLASPELDPIERLIVPYARETIWYEPASVQRRGRELKERLTTPQFPEVIGIASLANMACRLAILLDAT